MARFGFCGPSYASQSPNADAEVCRNWYLEAVETGQGPASTYVLYPTPGLSPFCTLLDSPLRALFEFGGRMFAVAGETLFEVMADGTSVNRGQVADDGQPAQMAANAKQLLVVAGGHAWWLDLKTNILHRLDDTSGAVLQGNPVMCGASDGYLIVLLAGSQKFQVSQLEDAATWTQLGVPVLNQVSEFPDQVLAMLVDHRQPWMFGAKATLPYFDAGAPGIVFEPVQGGYIEQGIIAPWSAVKMNNSIYWLGGSDRGQCIAWNAQGYQPVRVSNHAVETAWSSYSKVSDAVAFSYEDQGHTFWVIRFPTANKTWVYDAATGMWHERSTWSKTQGVDIAHPACCHTFAFGLHLVGDATSGNIYQMAIPSRAADGSWQSATDNGVLIRRVRRAPHVQQEKEWMFHHELQLDVESGLGPPVPLVDGQGNQRSPMLTLRWSDDGGHTWSQDHDAGFGAAGQYSERVIWRRLGRSRDRVYELTCSEPVPCRVINAYLIATPGFAPSESLQSQFRKIS